MPNKTTGLIIMLTTPLAIVTLAHHTFASEDGFLPHVEVIASSALIPYVPNPYPEWIIPAESLLPMTAQVGDSQQKPIIASPMATSFVNLPSQTVFRMPSATTLATWTERMLCSSDGCGAMPKSVNDSRALQTISASTTNPVCQNSISHTATITPPAAPPDHPYWASELIFSKTAGLKYCHDYPNTISRCMAHYTNSFSAHYNVTVAKTETEIKHVKLYPGHTITQTEIETETEVEKIKTTVAGPHWGIEMPTALSQARGQNACWDESSCIHVCERQHRKSLRTLVVLSSVFGVLTLISLIGMLAKHFGKKREDHREVARNTPRVS